MILHNKTKNLNIIFESFKEKQTDQGFNIGPGCFVDLLTITRATDEQIKNNNEIQMYLRQDAIELLTEYPSDPAIIAKMKNEMNAGNKKIKIDRIDTTYSLTELEDIIKNTKDVDELRAAQARMSEVMGETENENPELDDRTNNPII